MIMRSKRRYRKNKQRRTRMSVDPYLSYHPTTSFSLQLLSHDPKLLRQQRRTSTQTHP